MWLNSGYGGHRQRSGDPNLSDMKAFYEVLLLAPEQMGIENLGLFPLL